MEQRKHAERISADGFLSHVVFELPVFEARHEELGAAQDGGVDRFIGEQGALLLGWERCRLHARGAVSPRRGDRRSRHRLGWWFRRRRRWRWCRRWRWRRRRRTGIET